MWTSRKFSSLGIVLGAALMMAAGSVPAMAAVAGPAACLPSLDTASPLQAKGWAGSSVMYGETATTRWVTYACVKPDGATPRHDVIFVGEKASTTPTALAGRLQTIMKSADPMKALRTAQARFAVDDLSSPSLAPGWQAAKAAASKRRFVLDIDATSARLTEQ